MRTLFSWLIRRPVLAFIGVLILSLLVWFEGPLLAFDDKKPFESSTTRWVVIALLLVAWVLYFGLKWLWARLADLRLRQGVVVDTDATVVQPGATESASEVVALGKRFQEALDTLRKAHGGRRGAHYLYDIPWYLIVGAPGGGKTTALNESGLQFPLADQFGKGPIGGVGGTRNCDWWFADEAVLLDTAGRYITQDSFGPADQGAWLGFLGLLKKHRRRRPINGLILAVSALDLLQQDEGVHQHHVRAVRERIKELHDKLGIRFPIYVVITKCDLLAGFVEFFDQLGKDERGQVWGVTFPYVDASHVEQTLAMLPAEMKTLERQLQRRMVDRIQQERDLRRRALIYGFPQQFALLHDSAQRFVREVFSASRYQEPALLRGMYFTSATQNGSPIDRIIGALANSFDLPRAALPANASSGRSYFINRLLREVVFAESGLAGADLRLEQRRKYLQWGGITGIVLITLLLGAGLITSYVRNQQLIQAVAASTGTLQHSAKSLQGRNGPLDALPLLDQARALPTGYAERAASVPLSLQFGLYQGDNLGEQTQATYRRLLTDALQPQIVNRLEDDLRRSEAVSADQLYNSLRTYLMLGDRTHLDPKAVASWGSAWVQTLQGATTAQRAALIDHVAAWAESLDTSTAVPTDSTLIAQARTVLANMPTEQRIYSALKREMMDAPSPAFDIVQAAGKDAASALTRKSGQALTQALPGLYTVEGYKRLLSSVDGALANAAKDNWILDQQTTLDPRQLDDMKAAVLQLYYDDYIKQWEALLADVTVVNFNNLDQAARVLNLLGGAASPLKKFLVAAAKETTLAPVEAQNAAVLDKVKGKLKTLTQALGGTAQPAGGDAGNPVDVHFDDLHKLANAPAGTPSALDHSLAAMKEASAFLDATNAAKKTGSPAPPGDALLKLRREAEGKPAPLSAILQSADGASSALTQGSERERLNALWNAQVAPFCRQAVAGRYPISRGQAKEITPDDFGRLFAPAGLVDDFFQKNLQQYVDMSGPTWRLRGTGSDSLGIPPDTLAEFQRAARIRDTFFALGGNQPSFRFQLKPLSIDPALTKLAIDIDGTVMTLSTTALASATPFQVPSGKGLGAAKVDYAPSNGAGSLHTDGPWALFRLLDKATVETTPQAERYKVTFDLEGKKASFELTASSVINPFRRDVLERFRCLDRL
ncbi:type VI secretion system protein ImpL [Chitinivorax tropicus]|uniref:Type VI secretion system protein ImpL n=1 Tax=Chitinivorax tropicus TaxID=714531 RepID=A0A840MQM8_9PROT|nr:type VI secretion system membrane subunit TssM [Chitinivorax tropicus]MBB5018756.1 type VI secretion system protein ImpL [Chitinivorax tropicus]